MEISDKLFGNNIEFSFEHRLFNALAFFSIVLSIFSIVINFVLPIHTIVNAVISVYLILVTIFYFISRIRSSYKNYVLIYIFSTLLMLSFIWFNSGGYDSPIALVFLLLLVIINVVVIDKKQNFYFAVIMINLSALYLISFYYPDYNVKYESESVRFIDIFATLIIVASILFAFLKVHTKNYIEDRVNAGLRKIEVDKLNHALMDTNNKISDKNKLLEDLSKVLEANNIIINKQLEELNEAYRQLELSNQTQTKFLSIISHDLRSPIGSFKSLTSSMVNDYDLFSRDEQKNLIELMSNSAGSIYELLENLLTWSSIQQGRIAFNPQMNNIFQTVDITFKLLEISAISKRIKLINLINKSTIAFFDENMIVTVVRNLVSNALKFSRPDSIIVISATDKDNFVEVRVKDKGMGIKSEDLDKLFRIDVDIRMISPSPYTSEKGTGLGLILCREFVEKNGGTIQVESTLGVGRTFLFTIPKS